MFAVVENETGERDVDETGDIDPVDREHEGYATKLPTPEG